MLELVEDLALLEGLKAITVIKLKEAKKIINITLNLYSEKLYEPSDIKRIMDKHSCKGVFATGTPFEVMNYRVTEVKKISSEEELVYDPFGFIYHFKK